MILSPSVWKHLTEETAGCKFKKFIYYFIFMNINLKPKM